MLTLPFFRNYAKPDWIKPKLRTLFTLALFLSPLIFPSQALLGAQELPDNLIQSKLLRTEDQEVYIAYSGNQDKMGVVFVHGTPGDWSAFERYLTNPELQRDFFMVSLDRPEWGSSTLLNDQNPNLFTTQAEAIELIFKQYPTKRWLIVGHSLGASIAPKLALKPGNSIDGLLLLAGSLDPALGKPRWFNHLANNMLLKWFVPRKLRSSNKEIMQLRDELNLLESELKNITLNTRLTVIQGMKDRLVSPRNASYVRENWQNTFKEVSIIELENGGHFLPWRQEDLVIEQIRRLDNIK